MTSVGFFQTKNGFQFESETDTEIIPKLLKMINDAQTDDDLTFRELVERAIQQLVAYPIMLLCNNRWVYRLPAVT